jgi:16S rRNA (guanine966-N2)-methyltransferase
VTRVIGGTAGGRRLRTPHGDRTRPTSDRVREALFSALESALGSLAGLRFLDLYAGSGAVGLEAASRGAGHARLVEHDRRAARLAEDNARLLGLADRVEVVAQPVATALGRRTRPPYDQDEPHRYDVVFADPPYRHPDADVADALTLLAAHGWLAPGAVVVVERSSRAALAWPVGYAPDRVRTYGETALHWARWTGGARP